MLKLKPMDQIEFEVFKEKSQSVFSYDLAKIEKASLEQVQKNAAQQFNRLVPQGLNSTGQFFYMAYDPSAEINVGYLWLGITEKYERKIASINDIHIYEEFRSKGFGRQLLKLADRQAKELGADKIRLHVFCSNQIARQLYESEGFRLTSLDMSKEI